jgi:hypothetical protein
VHLSAGRAWLRSTGGGSSCSLAQVVQPVLVVALKRQELVRDDLAVAVELQRDVRLPGPNTSTSTVTIPHSAAGPSPARLRNRPWLQPPKVRPVLLRRDAAPRVPPGMLDADTFVDLPGNWQAATVKAEQNRRKAAGRQSG